MLKKINNLDFWHKRVYIRLTKMTSVSENLSDVDIKSSAELRIIRESEMENEAEENKNSTGLNLKHLGPRDSIGSSDSDVSLSYESGPNDQQTDNQNEEEQMADNDTTDTGSDDNGSSGKDSGCEVSNLENSKLSKTDNSEEEESPFEPPDEDLVNRIVAQVEFYFSDANIMKDAFLLKHVKRNKEGYVSLKLISSFKRVKHLAKDWRVVAYALKKSTKLEVNETNTKLRRVDPLPPFDQTAPSRTIVAINLPMEKPSIESVAEIFRDFGEIALVRIIRPGNPIPADVRSFANKHPEMSSTVSALVEFDRTESAKFAIERLDSDWRGGMQGMKVIELNAPPSDKKKKTQSKKTVLNKLMEGELSSSCQSSSEAEAESKYRQRRSSSPHPMRGAEFPRLQRRFSGNRDLGVNFVCNEQYIERMPCTCCNHCERRCSSSGSGYDSPVPSGYRRYSMGKEAQEGGYQIPAVRRFSGADSACCLLRRCSRDSGSESSGSFTRPQELSRRFSRDSISSTESAFQRRYSRDSISSESIGNFRRFSKDSVGSDVFAPPFLSRSNSKDLIDFPRRSSFGSNNGCEHYPMAHSLSRSSFGMPSGCVTSCSPHIPENVLRMPKGPDGSRGFITAQ